MKIQGRDCTLTMAQDMAKDMIKQAKLDTSLKILALDLLSVEQIAQMAQDMAKDMIKQAKLD